MSTSVRVDKYVTSINTFKYPFFLFKLKLFAFLLQSFNGILHVVWGSCDLDFIAVFLWGRNGDVHIKLLHHRPYVLSLLSDDTTMEVVWHCSLLSDRN